METENAILEKKSLDSIDKYGHHIVIGNLLHNHKDKVIFHYNEKDRNPDILERSEEEKSSSFDIEKKIVETLKVEHDKYINLN